MYGEATYGQLLWGANLAAVAVAATGTITSTVLPSDAWGATIGGAQATWTSQVLAGPPDGGNQVTWNDSLLWNDAQVWTEALGWVGIADAFGSRSDSASAADARISAATTFGLWSGTAHATAQFVPPVTASAISTDSAKAADTGAALAVAFGALTSSASADSAYLTVQGPLGVMVADATASDLSDSLASAFAAWTSEADAEDTSGETSGNIALVADSASAADTSAAAAAAMGLSGHNASAVMTVTTGQSVSVITTTSNVHADEDQSVVASAVAAWSSSAGPAGPFATVFLVNLAWTAEAAAFAVYSYDSLTAGAIDAEALAADTWAATSQPKSDFIMYSRPRIAVLTGRTKAA